MAADGIVTTRTVLTKDEIVAALTAERTDLNREIKEHQRIRASANTSIREKRARMDDITRMLNAATPRKRKTST